MITILPYLFALTAAAAAPAEASRLAVENCNVGEIYAFNKGECDITLSNDGDRPIRVFDVKTASDGDSVEPRELNVPAHAHAYLKAKIDSANSAGYSHHAIHFLTDEPGHEDRKASASAFVMTVLDETSPRLDFGVVKAPAEQVSKSIELSSPDVADFRISKIVEAPSWLQASVAADGRSLSAVVKPDAGWGLHADFVKLAINAPQQRQAWVEVKADIQGDIVPGSNPYDMNLMRIGSDHEFRIPLRSRSGKEFQIGKIELDGVQGTAQLAPCEKPTGDCRMLVLNVTDQQQGQIRGHVWIELPEFHQRLNLAVWGLLVPKDLKVRKLDTETMAHAKDGDAAQTQSGQVIDLQHAVKAAVANANPEALPGVGPLLKWAIANGLAIHGFQIFRAGNEAGPFALLNAKTIPSMAKTQDSISYQYRDNSAESGKTYWYYIGIVYNDGHKQQLTGPQKVIAR